MSCDGCWGFNLSLIVAKCKLSMSAIAFDSLTVSLSKRISSGTVLFVDWPRIYFLMFPNVFIIIVVALEFIFLRRPY